MDDEPNVWAKHAEKVRRREQLDRIDAWLSAFHAKRPILFVVFTAAIAVILAGILCGILHLLDRVSP